MSSRIFYLLTFHVGGIFYLLFYWRNNVTVKEVSTKLGLSPGAVYRMIKEKRGVGAKFEYRQGEGWFIYAKDVK